MCVSAIYRVIDRSRTETEEPTYFFMMNCLLYSRMESGHPSNDEFFDEDVNVYLASLLTAHIDPERREHISRYLAPYDLNLFERVSAADSPRTKYMIYKTNADALLLATGIFRNARRRRPNSAVHMKASAEVFIGRGKAYYALAQSYAIETFRRSTGVSEVLGKLSRGFEKYVKILSLMRGQYLNLYKRFSGGELFHLESSVSTIDSKDRLKELHDDFLDAYSVYTKDKKTAHRNHLEKLASDIKRIDPGFSFEIT